MMTMVVPVADRRPMPCRPYDHNLRPKERRGSWVTGHHRRSTSYAVDDMAITARRSTSCARRWLHGARMLPTTWWPACYRHGRHIARLAGKRASSCRLATGRHPRLRASSSTRRSHTSDAPLQHCRMSDRRRQRQPPLVGPVLGCEACGARAVLRGLWRHAWCEACASCCEACGCEACGGGCCHTLWWRLLLLRNSATRRGVPRPLPLTRGSRRHPTTTWWRSEDSSFLGPVCSEDSS